MGLVEQCGSNAVSFLASNNLCKMHDYCLLDLPLLHTLLVVLFDGQSSPFVHCSSKLSATCEWMPLSCTMGMQNPMPMPELGSIGEGFACAFGARRLT